jgi:hypothetical protein
LICVFIHRKGAKNAKVKSFCLGDYTCNVFKAQIIFTKSALLFIAVLPVRWYFWTINGKEEKTSLRP